MQNPTGWKQNTAHHIHPANILYTITPTPAHRRSTESGSSEHFNSSFSLHPTNQPISHPRRLLLLPRQPLLDIPAPLPRQPPPQPQREVLDEAEHLVVGGAGVYTRGVRVDAIDVLLMHHWLSSCYEKRNMCFNDIPAPRLVQRCPAWWSVFQIDPNFQIIYTAIRCVTGSCFTCSTCL